MFGENLVSKPVTRTQGDKLDINDQLLFIMLLLDKRFDINPSHIILNRNSSLLAERKKSQRNSSQVEWYADDYDTWDKIIHLESDRDEN